MARSILSAGGRVLSQGGRVLSFEQSTLDPDLTTYITGLVTPLSEGQLTLLNNFITTVKTGLSITNLSDAFDAMLIIANETSEAGLRNLVKRSHDATLSATAPSFTALEGFTGNGTSSYIEMNINLLTEGINYQLNDASYGIYFRTFDRVGFKYNGVYSTTADGGINNRLNIGSDSGSQINAAINSSSVTISGESDTHGMYILRRSVNTQFHWSRNKTHSLGSRASTKIPNQSAVVLARRTVDTTVGIFNASQISFVFYGKGLTEGQSDTIYDAIQAYMTANGKEV